MEAKREAKITEYLKGKSRPAILRNLKSLEVDPILIKSTIEMYEETQSIEEDPNQAHQCKKRPPESSKQGYKERRGGGTSPRCPRISIWAQQQ